MTVDGNTAVAYIAYAFSEIAAVYPITPSSTMAERMEEWALEKRKNIWGEQVKVVEMQSETGAAGTMHGALQSGCLATTFTASQGLLLMLPTLYRLAGELLPGVIHVSARALATHALSIFGDHQDIMAVRASGVAILAGSSVQEAHDLAAIAHLSALEAGFPFINFMDGFRTSHEIQKINTVSYEALKKLVKTEALERFRKRGLSPIHPVIRGTAQNPDIYFQSMEARNQSNARVIEVIREKFDQWETLTNRRYFPFRYTGAKDALYVIVAMGSVCETIEEVVNRRVGQGEKVGMIRVVVYRPFSASDFCKALPESTEKVAVLDRTKEGLAVGEPLYQDVVSSLMGEVGNTRPIKMLHGRYGLGSKDTRPCDIEAVFENLMTENPKEQFTIGIFDDVTGLSLTGVQKNETHPQGETNHFGKESMYQCKLWGFGSDGTVGMCKQLVKLIGDFSDRFVQAYFSYDSKKSGGLTVSHLRFSGEPIHAPYLIETADYVACHHSSYLRRYELVKDLKNRGIFVLNADFDAKKAKEYVPTQILRELMEKNADFYVIPANRIAEELGLNGRISMIMEGAFLQATGFGEMKDLLPVLEEKIGRMFERKGEEIVKKNKKALYEGMRRLEKVVIEKEWILDATSHLKELQERNGEEAGKLEELKETAISKRCSQLSDSKDFNEEKNNLFAKSFISEILTPMECDLGDNLSVGKLLPYADGTFPGGTSAYEKRGVSAKIPVWISENCIQCNQCALVCPHGCIRPYLLTEDEVEDRRKKDASFVGITPSGLEKAINETNGQQPLVFRIQVSPLDCTGCGNCVDRCPSKPKALAMEYFREKEIENYQYVEEYCENHWKQIRENLPNSLKEHVKYVQFEKPYIEFSGACAGCGETPYVKLLTQLFGDRCVIANATGCSSIWGASVPSFPYCRDEKGRGPAWANSLFEDNAEYGFGMYLAGKERRERVRVQLQTLCEDYKQELQMTEIGNSLLDAAGDYLKHFAIGETSYRYADLLAERLEAFLLETKKQKNESEYQQIGQESLTMKKQIEILLSEKDDFVKNSNWIFGGDGWAYDIGFGGLDHVLSSGEDINVLVFDTQVYSNTGGQASKATPYAAVAKFALNGKRQNKKDLGKMMMTYGNVYVAQISLGANPGQAVKAMREAEHHTGPSLLIAYAPCINHGILGGMGKSIASMKEAVDSGYWNLYRYCPWLVKEKKNPLILDSKPNFELYQTFLRGQIRFQSLNVLAKNEMEQLWEHACREAYENYHYLNKMMTCSSETQNHGNT